MSLASIKPMAHQPLANSLFVNPVNGKVACESCILAKQVPMHRSTPSRPTCEPLELVHLDLNGSWSPPSLYRTQAGEVGSILACSKYCLVPVDYAGAVWVSFYAHKDQFHEKIAQFKAIVETHWETGREKGVVSSSIGISFEGGD